MRTVTSPTRRRLLALLGTGAALVLPAASVAALPGVGVPTPSSPPPHCAPPDDVIAPVAASPAPRTCASAGQVAQSQPPTALDEHPPISDGSPSGLLQADPVMPDPDGVQAEPQGQRSETQASGTKRSNTPSEATGPPGEPAAVQAAGTDATPVAEPGVDVAATELVPRLQPVHESMWHGAAPFRSATTETAPRVSIPDPLEAQPMELAPLLSHPPSADIVELTGSMVLPPAVGGAAAITAAVAALLLGTAWTGRRSRGMALVVALLHLRRSAEQT